MSKPISLCEYRKRKEIPVEPLPVNIVPIAMYAKGKFTLAFEFKADSEKKAIVFNTTTKVVISRRTPPTCEGIKMLKTWAEEIVHMWEAAHGHIEED